MFGAELRPQPPHVHVDRARAAEVVVSPHLVQQLVAREHPILVLGKELQQFELLEGEVEVAAAELGGVAGLVDHQVAAVHDVGRLGLGLGGRPLDREPQPGIHLGRAGVVQQHLVQTPVEGDDGDPALGDHADQRDAQVGRRQQPGERAGRCEVATAVDEDGGQAVGALSGEQGRGIGGTDAYPVHQEAEGRQHVGIGLFGVGEQQQRHHGLLPSSGASMSMTTAGTPPVRPPRQA